MYSYIYILEKRYIYIYFFLKSYKSGCILKLEGNFRLVHGNGFLKLLIRLDKSIT